MHYRILLVLAIVTINYCFGMDMVPQDQRIIVLNGTTTAGKTSIASELKKQLEDQSYRVEILEIDKFLVPKVQWAVATNRSNPFNCFVPNSEIITSSEIEAIGKESQLELCQAAKNAYAQGKIVIIDAPMYRPAQIEFYYRALENLKITWTLVYCPISLLVDRIVKRNESSGTTNQRSILQALNQFNCLYKNQSMEPIDTLSKSTLLYSLDKARVEHDLMQAKLWDLLKSVQRAICPYEFESIKNTMLARLSPEQESEIQIGSAVFHNLVVNTGLNNPSECAEQIMAFLSQKHDEKSCN